MNSFFGNSKKLSGFLKIILFKRLDIAIGYCFFLNKLFPCQETKSHITFIKKILLRTKYCVEFCENNFSLSFYLGTYYEL